MNSDRFFSTNDNQKNKGDKSYQQRFWPPMPEYKLSMINLADEASDIINNDIKLEFTKLGLLIQEDWKLCVNSNAPAEYELKNSAEIASCFRKIASLYPDDEVKKNLELRASIMESGYKEERLKELTNLDVEFSLVAGKIATWFSKYNGGLPSAFATIKDHKASEVIAKAHHYIDSCKEYVYRLHKHLLISELPVFAPGNLFFAAGEANTHPKHIAYFLPEDEGIPNSPHQKTYYFVNTHQKILESVSLPLADSYLNLNNNLKYQLNDFEEIQTLGVFAHEIGHFVHIKGYDFTEITEKNRWISYVMQETAADVFGILFVAQVLAPHFNIKPETVIYYYLAECFRYVDRGLGVFADSDGMLLQLNYFLELGALSIDPETGQISGNADHVIAALRSLGRVLADTLLTSNIERIENLYKRFGPNQQSLLSPLLKQFAKEPSKSIEYIL